MLGVCFFSVCLIAPEVRSALPHPWEVWSIVPTLLQWWLTSHISANLAYFVYYVPSLLFQAVLMSSTCSQIYTDRYTADQTCGVSSLESILYQIFRFSLRLARSENHKLQQQRYHLQH